MKEYSVQDIMRIINKKRKDYYNYNKKMPNKVEINNVILTQLELYYLPLVIIDKINIIYGMDIVINNKIKIPEEIEVYYKK